MSRGAEPTWPVVGQFLNPAGPSGVLSPLASCLGKEGFKVSSFTDSEMNAP